MVVFVSYSYLGSLQVDIARVRSSGGAICHFQMKGVLRGSSQQPMATQVIALMFEIEYKRHHEGGAQS